MRPLSTMAAGPINLDHPGTYLHWLIFTVSVANLCLIAVMVVIFGVALLLPFPKGRTYPPAQDGKGHLALTGRPLRPALTQDADMWTNRVRRFATRILPPGKLLPDRQPAYVASWIYVFGVGSLAAFGVAVVSGFALALGGPGLVALQLGGPLLQQPPSVECGTVHGPAGHSSLGKVLDGRLARQASLDLDHRGGRVRRLGRRVFHRVRVPAEF